MKKFFKFFLLFLLAAVVFYTFWFLYTKSKPQVTVYELVSPETATIQKNTVATGKIEPRDEILIKPQISGIIEELYKEAGQTILKGEAIAKVKVIPELGQLSGAESRLNLAQINARQAVLTFDRQEKLFKGGVITQEEYEKAQVSFATTKEELENAKNSLDIIREGITQKTSKFSNTIIRSTIDGLILNIPIKAGNSVILSNTFNDGTTIASVANMNDLIFRGNIDETEVGRIKEGMPITLTIGALQNLKFDAVLEYISPKGVETNGANLFEIKAAIKVPKTTVIRSGYSANAEIVLAKSDSVLTIPESAVEFVNDSSFVYIVTKEKPVQEFKREHVKIGISDGIKIEIKEGLTKAQKVRGTAIDPTKKEH